MKGYQDRVIVEKKELDEKIKKLSNFIFSDKFDEVSERERPLIRNQFYVMLSYSETLVKRIEIFGKEDE